MPFYYPNWINDFWRIMGLIHFGDKSHFCVPGEKRFDEALIRAFCSSAGLAFYDTACEVRRLRDNASDAFLEVVTPTDIPALLARIPSCHTLVTTGEKASQIVAQTFGCPVPSVGGCIDVRSFVANAPQDDKCHSELYSCHSELDSCHSELDSCHSELYSCHSERSEESLYFWRMPSTSRAYPLPLEKKAEAYRQLFI